MTTGLILFAGFFAGVLITGLAFAIHDRTPLDPPRGGYPPR